MFLKPDISDASARTFQRRELTRGNTIIGIKEDDMLLGIKVDDMLPGRSMGRHGRVRLIVVANLMRQTKTNQRWQWWTWLRRRGADRADGGVARAKAGGGMEERRSGVPSILGRREVTGIGEAAKGGGLEWGRWRLRARAWAS